MGPFFWLGERDDARSAPRRGEGRRPESIPLPTSALGHEQTLVFTIWTCRNCRNCKDRPPPIHRRRVIGLGSYPLRIHSSCLQTRNTVRRPRQCRLLDDPSNSAAQRVRRHVVRISHFPHPGANCPADPHNAGIGIGTDRVDRIGLMAERAPQQRDSARREHLAPPGRRHSCRESLPRGTARRVFGRPCAQIIV